MRLNFTTLDVFSESKYSGNPLAIVELPVDIDLDEAQKQLIANEFNLSETVFLHGTDSHSTTTQYDIFSSKARIAFAGHPTIGTVKYLMTLARDRFPDVKTLHTLAGKVLLSYDDSTGLSSVEVPHNIHEHKKCMVYKPPPNSTSTDSVENIPIVSIVKGMAFSLVPMVDLAALGAVNQGLLPSTEVYLGTNLDQHDGWNKGYHGTLYYVNMTDSRGETGPPSTNTTILRTRVIGSREDPGTGSASSALCSYLSLQRSQKDGRGPFKYHLIQGVEMGRKCDIFVEVHRSDDGTAIEKVVLTGSAVKVMEGTIDVRPHPV